MEQIFAILKELNLHASQLDIKIDLTLLINEFNQLNQLRHQLIERVRLYGITVWASFHHLFKQLFNQLKNYRESIQNPKAKVNTRESVPTKSDLKRLYSMGKVQLEHLIAVQEHILNLLIAITADAVETNTEKLKFPTIMHQPSKLLIVTVHRCEVC